MSARDFLPPRRTLSALAQAAEGCQGCPLYAGATQTVFGEGSAQAALMLLGEIPGDQEDRQGRPFVGPAGRLIDEVLAEAGIQREAVYVTNAVKHFKYVMRGKRRLHQKPTAREITACQPWLLAEIEAIGPQGIVCLGATAAQALLGKDFRLTQQFGQFQTSPWASWILATYHPAAVLRAPTEEARHTLRGALLGALQLAAKRLAERRVTKEGLRQG